MDWVTGTLLLLVLLHPGAGSSGAAQELMDNSTWLNVTIKDDIVPGGGPIDGYTKSSIMNVFASRFNYSLNLPAVKVMIRGNLGKPSPSAADPLVVSVRNWAGGHTFTVPYNIYDRHGRLLGTMDHATRYLCPGPPGHLEHAVVSVGTGHLPATESFHYQVSFQRIGHWNLLLDAPEKLAIQPTDPGMFEFAWPERGSPEVLLLKLNTVQYPEVCTTVALQPRVCPLAQTVAELSVASTYFTVSESGEMTVRREQFPDGFFLLLLPQADDIMCDPSSPVAANFTRKKTVMVTLTAHELPRSLLAVPAVLAAVLVVLGAASACLLRRDLTAPRLDLEHEPETERPRRGSLALSEDLLLDGQLEPETPLQAQEAPPRRRSPVSLLVAAVLLLLALGGEALLSAFGAIRLSGDLDVCYRNELCSLTSGGVPGLNHLVARLPYVGAGLGLLLAVRVQKLVYRRVTIEGTIRIGAPHEWSLLDAVALALVAQGLLSGLQSTCPRPGNAPLDVAFVYFALTALACKLFQTRRGPWAAGHYAPLLLTGALVLAELAKQRAGDAWYVWLVLAVLHLLVTLVVGLQLYVLGDVSADPAALQRVWEKSHLPRESTNFQINRATFVAVLLANLALAIGAGVSRMEEFSHYAMIFFAVHAVLFTVYYLLLKLVKSEESAGRVSLALLALGLLLLMCAVATLTGWSTFSVSSTPAVSRLMRRPCLAGGLYDAHDLWHLLAAPSLLCLALGLLLLDDNLLLTPRLEIQRF